MLSDTAGTLSGWTGRLTLWAGRVGLAKKLAIALMISAIVSGFATYAAFTGSAPFSPNPTVILVLLNLDLVLLLALGSLVARRIVQVWVERRRGSAGSRLHIRLVVMFSLVAVTPTIIVAVFSVLFFNFGIESWFSDRVRTAIKESLVVAESYVKEHKQVIRGDALAMATDLNRLGPRILGNPRELSRQVSAQAGLRDLSEAIVFDGSGRILARARMSFVLEFDPLPMSLLDKTNNNKVVILLDDNSARIRALVRLDQFFDTYLYVGRVIERSVLSHMDRTKGAVREYEQLEKRRSGLQITFVLFFVVVALLMLLAAVWVGLNLANQLVRPVSGLVTAAERVRSGDLEARVDEGTENDELGSLSRAFNRMIIQLGEQRGELVEANRQLDVRRRFMETVLSGVSAGVIGLDREGKINFPNRSASALLFTDLHGLIGAPLGEVVPEMAELLETAGKRPGRLSESQIELVREGRPHTLLVRIAAERDNAEIRGFVVTFDDITELLSAQRQATWADVARRLAHEIKNPLTPIQLSADRLKRKYLAEIESDRETFEICVDTIIRQVDDIGGMLDEFSAFARMPAPVFDHRSLSEIVRRMVFLQKNANRDIEYHNELPDQDMEIVCDDRQIGQALTNLLQNAADSINERNRKTDPGDREIWVFVKDSDDHIAVTIEDSGIGLPSGRSKDITEPYVTTRSDGTGLGLAIVKKIMEDHKGELVFGNREGGGARVSLVFAKDENAPRPAEDIPANLKTAANES